MKHFGDITKIKGSDVPLVDIVCGGSPCQDLSIAGRREGLSGERSGLFMEQIRIIKEMRERDKSNRGADVDIRFLRPRYMVWENVPGAFSSNGGEDFRAVLEETAKIADETAVIPKLEGGQRWTPSGCILGDGWSIAWRVHDAQFWGVPQRRKRIALVADFAGGGAPEILFERESLPRNTEQSETERKEVTGSIGAGIDKAITFQERGGKPGGGKGILIQNDRTGALSTVNNQMVFDASRRHDANAGDNQQAIVYGISSYNSNAMKSDNPNSGIYEAETARTLDLNGGNPACNQGGMAVIQGLDAYNQTSTGDVAMPIRSKAADAEHIPCVCVKNLYTIGHDERSSKLSDNGITDPLTATDYKDPIKITYQNVTGTLDCGITKGTSNQLANNNMFVANTDVVRRLTPTECERLQGYPDGWTDIGEWVDTKGKKHKAADSPRYKALGNSIALPFWEWMAQRMVEQLKADGVENPTMASLFDGIGGFPLVYQRCGCEPVWASEIEEFPIAVTKIRFPDEGEKNE